MHTHYKRLAIFLLLLVACKQDEGADTDPQTEITLEDRQRASAVTEVDRFINEFEFIARSIRLSHPNQPLILGASTITSGQTEEGKSKWDMLFSNATGTDGKKRNGQLTVVFEDAFENGNTIQGKYLHVRSDIDNNLYSVDGIKFKGSLVFSNIAAAQASPDTKISHFNAQSFIIKPDAEEIRFSSTRKSRWIAGNTAGDTADDVFEISEQSYSLDIIKNGTEFVEARAISTVNLNFGCPQSLFYPKKGKLKVEHIGGKTRQLLFGSGNCSDIISLENY